MQDKRFSIFCFGNRWDEYERRDYNILSRLSEHDDFKYIFVFDPPLPFTSIVKYLIGRADDDARRGWERIFRQGLINNRGKVHILPSITITPLYNNKLLILLNELVLNLVRKLFIHYYIRKFQIKDFIFWISGPANMGEYFVKKNTDKFLCYNLCEDYVAKYKRRTHLHMRAHKNDIYLTKRANVVLVATTFLYGRKKRVNAKTFLVTNGVNFEAFDVERNYKTKNIPEDLMNIPRPILMNVGIISNRTDLSAINYIAENRKDWSIVHVGPEERNNSDIKLIKEHGNMYFLGPKPARDIPKYLSNADVCMLAYKANYQNKTGSSMRLFLYLASGKPIIAFRAGGAEDFSSIIDIVDSKEEFVKAMLYILQTDSLKNSVERLRVAKENSWEKKSEQVHSILKENLR